MDFLGHQVGLVPTERDYRGFEQEAVHLARVPVSRDLEQGATHVGEQTLELASLMCCQFGGIEQFLAVVPGGKSILVDQRQHNHRVGGRLIIRILD